MRRATGEGADLRPCREKGREHHEWQLKLVVCLRVAADRRIDEWNQWAQAQNMKSPRMPSSSCPEETSEVNDCIRSYDVLCRPRLRGRSKIKRRMGLKPWRWS